MVDEPVNEAEEVDRLIKEFFETFDPFASQSEVLEEVIERLRAYGMSYRAIRCALADSGHEIEKHD